MPILVTSIVKITDWQAWREAHRERLLHHAKQSGAQRYQIYRNVNDASQTLVVAEFADYDSARELSKALGEISELLTSSVITECMWEPTGWEDIDPAAFTASRKEVPQRDRKPTQSSSIDNHIDHVLCKEHTSMSNTTDNKAIARRYMENVMSEGDLRVAYDLCAPNFVHHFPGAPGPIDREATEQVGRMFQAGFPDIRVTIEDQVAEDDQVVTRMTFSGTHRGDFQGLAPTGKSVTFTGINIACIAGSKITELWSEFDALGVLQQLGAIPAQAAAGA
jgi:ketosteroid isomerase-like protein